MQAMTLLPIYRSVKGIPRWFPYLVTRNRSTSILHHSFFNCLCLKHKREFSCSSQIQTEKKLNEDKISSFDDLLKVDENNKRKQNPKNEATAPIGKRLMIVSVIITTLAAAYFYAMKQKEKEKLVEREVEVSKVDIGAQDYELTDHTGKRVTKKDFLGRWMLLYFGFTHCPDICPEELEKMTDIITLIDSDKKIPDLLPVFLSVDPVRDTPDAITEYLQDFHPNFVGLTGSEEEVKQAAKAFRVYYSAGPKDDDNDYIVDHTIVMYLMDPRGNFVDYYGSRSMTTENVVSGITKKMQNYARLHG